MPYENRLGCPVDRVDDDLGIRRGAGRRVGDGQLDGGDPMSAILEFGREEVPAPSAVV